MKHLISITLLLLYSTNAFSGSFLDLDEHGSVMRFGGQDFAYYENTTVKNWKALSSSNSKVRYRGEGVNNFIKSCLEKCASGDKGGPDGQCGGVALIYRDKNRTMPTMCLFASRESEVMPVGGSSRQAYDFYQIVPNLAYYHVRPNQQSVLVGVGASAFDDCEIDKEPIWCRDEKSSSTPDDEARAGGSGIVFGITPRRNEYQTSPTPHDVARPYVANRGIVFRSPRRQEYDESTNVFTIRIGVHF